MQPMALGPVLVVPMGHGAQVRSVVEVWMFDTTKLAPQTVFGMQAPPGLGL